RYDRHLERVFQALAGREDLPGGIAVFAAGLLCGLNLRRVRVKARRRGGLESVGGGGGEGGYPVRAHAPGELQRQEGDLVLLGGGDLPVVGEQVHACLVRRRGRVEFRAVRRGLEELPLVVGVGPAWGAVRAHALGVGERLLDVRRPGGGGRI